VNLPDRRQMSESSTRETTLLGVHNLRKSYRLGSNPIPVLQDLCLEVKVGEMVVIMGASGSGKTTLLNCVSGVDTPDAGEVSLDGRTVDYASQAERTLLRRHHIGMVFQFFNLIPTLTVSENVALPFLIAGKRGTEMNERVDRLLAEVGMSRRRDHHPFQLSGGEMQLTSIARALVHRPSLLLADEPTGNVNPHVGRSIMEILRRTAAREGAGVLMVTHSPEHAAWADRVCFLKDGAIAGEHCQGGRRDKVAPIHDRLLALGI
jgi:putative ABC transport system ATP-binding protein